MENIIYTLQEIDNSNKNLRKDETIWACWLKDISMLHMDKQVFVGNML